MPVAHAAGISRRGANGADKIAEMPLPATFAGLAPERGEACWAIAMAGQDFSGEDKLDTAAFNAARWTGMKGTPPPSR